MPPRQAKQHAAGPVLPPQTLVVDNGAYSIKAGWASAAPDPAADCRLIPNCMARGRDRKLWVGGQLDRCTDFGEMAFRRPVEKGYLVNWEAEKEIWDRSFFDKEGGSVRCEPRDTTLLLAEAPNAPSLLQANCDQMIFEEFGFASYYRCPGPVLNAYNDVPGIPPSRSETVLLVDSGFSHTTVTPLLRGQAILASVRRLDLGGKHLTNYLKELVSVRHYNMMDETHLMNEVKEAVCYASLSFAADLERTWKGGVGEKRAAGPDAESIVLDYVLPDYNAHRAGFARPHDPSPAAKAQKIRSATDEKAEEFMRLGNERFAVPELLFSPGDIGMKAPGLAELVMQSLETLPEGLWPGMLGNVVVVGGNAKIRGVVERIQHDLRLLAPSTCVRHASPVRATWLGGAHLAHDGNRATLAALAVSREEYLEHGAGWVGRKFASGAAAGVKKA
ncbi:MAG: Actin- protein 6 [Thelocarpon impressellum]|nr:MAG: Actin- protein 6 [Thelocarpon impressellum]